MGNPTELIHGVSEKKFPKKHAGNGKTKLALTGKSHRHSRTKKRDRLSNIERATLHFGCSVSDERFSVLWKAESVSARFGKRFALLTFCLSHDSVDYRLILSAELIRQIELRRPSNDTEFLLIQCHQMLGAPLILRRKLPDENWTRDVDFTPSLSIGQSSALCLEIPTNPAQIHNSHQAFLLSKERRGVFSLENGSSFSSNSNLVPMLLPPQGIIIPYKILFKVNSLVQHGFFPGQAINDPGFFQLLDPTRVNIEYIESALETLSRSKVCCYDPQIWLVRQYTHYATRVQIPHVPTVNLDEGFVYIHKVQITPTKIYFTGPEINISNRVLRNYPKDIENFLRVSFVDEDLRPLRSGVHMSKEGGRTSVYDRKLSVLRNGIVIGDKRFDFLAFSPSQLKKSSVWMFASRENLTAGDIRTWMGDFKSIKNVAKYSARLGQSFGSSTETFTVEKHDVDLIVDVENQRYCFSDGIGKISADFAGKVAAKCGLGIQIPSAFQIRFRGLKGVVAVDPTSSKKLSFRKSMCKYQSEIMKLDVVTWSGYTPCSLNRQIITLLSALGVNDCVFLKKQNEAMTRLNALFSDPQTSRNELELMFSGDIGSTLSEMISCGYAPSEEPFLAMMLRTFWFLRLFEIRTKARIYVPRGRYAIGCLDETATLEYGQVFMQCSSREILGGSSREKFVVNGKVVVAKNPCLHPGDVRVLEAVDVPSLRHMVDCVVFPQKGKRPHPNECSGSDLDGDMYFVCWDPELIPPSQFEPMDYTAPQLIHLDHHVTIQEVTKYFVDFSLDENIGIISTKHTIFADELSARSKPCLELAALFSVAVDFAKTGVPAAKIPRHLNPKTCPNFMENPNKPKNDKKSKKQMRRSSKKPSGSGGIISKLYEQAKDAKLPFLNGTSNARYDTDMEVEGFGEYVEDALLRKSCYDYKLGSLMNYYGIETEAEFLGGCFLKSSRRDSDSAKNAANALMKEAKAWLYEPGNGGDDEVVCAQKASAWYHVTYHPRYRGSCDDVAESGRFLSFPWCVWERLFAIKRGKMVK